MGEIKDNVSLMCLMHWQNKTANWPTLLHRLNKILLKEVLDIKFTYYNSNGFLVSLEKITRKPQVGFLRVFVFIEG
jgi:hypothetical protein